MSDARSECTARPQGPRDREPENAGALAAQAEPADPPHLDRAALDAAQALDRETLRLLASTGC